jgi:hypothetical protein
LGRTIWRFDVVEQIEREERIHWRGSAHKGIAGVSQDLGRRRRWRKREEALGLGGD